MNDFALSISIIVRDEKPRLPALWESLELLRNSLKAQVVITDTGSVDGTVELAQKMGAEVYSFAWCDDFSAARNACLSHCRAPFVLWLDADDRLPPETCQWIVNHLPTLNPKRVYTFEIISPMADGTRHRFSQIRLFPNHQGLEFRNPIHESLSESVIERGMKGVHSQHPILHTGYADDATVAAKNRRNKHLLETLLGKGTDKISPRFSLARTLQVEGDLTRALELFTGIARQPGARAQHADIYLASLIYAGQCLGFLNRLTEALHWFSHYEDEGRQNPQYLFEMAKLCWVAQDPQKAAQLFQACLKLQGFSWTIPTDWDSIYAGARSLLAQIPQAGNPSPPPGEPDSSAAFQQQFSVCTILKDEAHNIPELCANLPLSHIEWCVVDTGSTDNTLELLRQRGVEARHFAWCDDFSAARNFSLGAATRPYILWLDADDRLPADFWTRLRQALPASGSHGGPESAFRCIIHSPRETGAGDTFRQTRIFPGGRGLTFTGKIHEHLGESLAKAGVPVVDLDVTIIHTGYDTPEKRARKRQRNMSYLKAEVAAGSRDSKTLAELGHCYYQLKDYALALETYKQGWECAVLDLQDAPPADPMEKSYPTFIGNTLSALGLAQEAHTWYTTALRWNPDDLAAPFWIAKQCLEQKNFSEAEDRFRALVRRAATVGLVAGDNATLRKNALGYLVVLSLSKNPLPQGEINAWLEELVRGGLRHFPLDVMVPAEYYSKTGQTENLKEYYRNCSETFPDNITYSENYQECLVEAEKWDEILGLHHENPVMKTKSGVLAAFYARACEHANPRPDVHGLYIDSLRRFPEDPTLIVFFTDWLNHSRQYQRALEDLKSFAELPQDLQQLKTQLAGLAGA